MSVYFSKVEFLEFHSSSQPISILMLNLIQGELSYQVFDWKVELPAITGTAIDVINGISFESTIKKLAKVLKSSVTDFKSQIIADDKLSSKIIFSYGLKLSNNKLQELLPYCDALKFEPYRTRKISMNDKGYIGYRDERNIKFTAITNSYIPKMSWNMTYLYNEAHIWPSEKLYRFLIMKYFHGNKKLRGWYTPYSG